MKVQLSILILCIVFITIESQVIPWPPKSGQFKQKIDHFSFISNTRHYKLDFEQKYLYEDKWYKKGGPIFFYCGNEGPIEGFWNNTGFMFDIAPQFNALIIFGEHRYYGTSLPFGNVSFKQPYISYLSVDQALADFAFMITTLKEILRIENARVITFGGSYGGMLAGFMRFKYPNVVHGALVASAPMYWVSGQGNFQQFFETITADYRNINGSCVNIVKKGFKMMEDLANQGKFDQISKSLKTCSRLSSKADVYYAMNWIRNGFVMMSMMDYPYAASFMGNLPAYPVNVSCNNILLNSADSIAALREAVAVFYGSMKCYDPNSLFHACADITGCGLGPASLAWDFQACTEMSLYDRGTISSKSMFPNIPFSFGSVDRYCQKIWEVTRIKNQMKIMQRPTDVSEITNVIYSNGDLDPWGKGGILPGQKLPKSSIALIVKGGAHHLDLRGSNKADPPSVRQVRQIEVQYIKQWLQQ